MDITPDTHVARVAVRNPATIRVFQRHGIDFCCGGKRPLAEACADAGLDFAALRGELDAAAAGPAADERDWDAAPLAELAEHIVSRYHERLREDLPRLSEMADRVLRAHGEKHPEVVPEVHRVFAGVRAELETHTQKEERILFPYVSQLEELDGRGGVLPGSPFGSVKAPIDCMEDEHTTVAEALARLREVTGGFEPPSGACPTFRGLYHGLAELEADTHRHIHLENNVLFPRAIELEGRLLGSAA
jgi:regulator of cell morphogenesis and NO signaling